MSYIQIAIDTFKAGIPTKKEFNSKLWREYFHKMSADERKVLKVLGDYADAYHDVEKGRLNIDSYARVILRDGTVNPLLPSEIDANILINKFTVLKTEQEAARNELIASRKLLIDAEIAHIKQTLKALDKRLKTHGLSYSVVESVWYTNDLQLHDSMTDKVYSTQIND